MKVMRPVGKLPPEGSGKGKNADIYRAVKGVPSDKWLPIRFKTNGEARTRQWSLTNSSRARKLVECRVRGNVLYVRNREAK